MRKIIKKSLHVHFCRYIFSWGAECTPNKFIYNNIDFDKQIQVISANYYSKLLCNYILEHSWIINLLKVSHCDLFAFQLLEK